MRRLTAAVMSLLLLCAPIAQAIGAEKAGTKCQQLNSVSKVSGVKYVCLKSGTKLTWRKSTTVVASNSSEKAKKELYKSVKLKAYTNIRAVGNGDGSSKVKLIYHIGESFPADLKSLYVNQFVYASKLYGTFFDKEELVNIYLYTEKEADLIKSDPNLSFNYSDFEMWFNQWKAGVNREHNIGLASYYLLRNSPPQGHSGLAVFSGSSLSSIRPYGIQVAQHEYWHIVQDYYMQVGRGVKFDDSDSYDLLFPPTFREGSTNTISFAMSSNTSTDYLKLYEVFISDKKKGNETPLFKTLTSKEKVVAALRSIEVRSKNPEAHEASYLLGQLLYEWVIAEYGFEGYRKLITNQLVGKSFEDNLRVSLGVTTDELYKGAASHILTAFAG